MLRLLECQFHKLPIDIVVSRKDNCAAYCQACFQILSKQEHINQAVKLNSHTLDIFESSTTFVYEKLSEWIEKMRHSDAYAIFEEINHNQTSQIFYGSIQIFKKIANQVIQEYRILIKGNKQSVLSQKIPQILYHHEFLKDIYNLLTKSWKVSAYLIASNFSQMIKQSTSLQRQFKVKAQLIEEIDRQRMRMMSQNLEFVIVMIHPLLDIMNRGNLNKEQVQETDYIQQDQMNQLNHFQAPVLIKKVQSFQEVKPYVSSSKTIEERFQQTNFNRVRNVRKSKFIEQKEYFEANNQYVALLKEMEVIRLENDNLRQQNQVWKTQNRFLSLENKAFKKQSKFILNHNDPQQVIAASLNNENLKNDIQIENNNHDLLLLVQYVKSLQQAEVLDKNLLGRIISQLKTSHINL